mmetsp:Transcript_6177/g.18806  ORF Transcript_6177/g.18806 Transcript_6177/m.18806 type:complete len:400 (-) Transcript_6177:14-1213(-)
MSGTLAQETPPVLRKLATRVEAEKAKEKTSSAATLLSAEEEVARNWERDLQLSKEASAEEQERRATAVRELERLREEKAIQDAKCRAEEERRRQEQAAALGLHSSAQVREEPVDPITAALQEAKRRREEERLRQEEAERRAAVAQAVAMAMNHDGKALIGAGGDPSSQENDIQAAMRRFGLRHAQYGRKVGKDELSVEEQTRVARSAAEARERAGRVRPDDPSIMRALLKWHRGNIGEKRRIFNDFLLQWPRADLRLLRAIGQGASEAELNKLAQVATASAAATEKAKEREEGEEEEDREEEEESSLEKTLISLTPPPAFSRYLSSEVGSASGLHPFLEKAADWHGLLQSEPYAMSLMDEAIARPIDPQLDTEAIWCSVVLDYERILDEQLEKLDRRDQ